MARYSTCSKKAAHVAVLTTVATILLPSAGRPATVFPKEDTVAICTRHLRAIAQGLRAYQHDKGELPPHLSDLYPAYLPDDKVFQCPADPPSDTPGPGAEPLRISYFYTMSTDTVPGPLTPQLSPRPFDPRTTWRDYKNLQRIHFGDRVPVVNCVQHDGSTLNLTLSGEVYRGDWPAHPGTIGVMLDRMEHDLAESPAQFVQDWSLGATEGYASTWIDAPLRPALRFRLATVADQLARTTKAFPAFAQSSACNLAAMFYRAAGRTKGAIAACQEALRLPGDHEGANFLLADLRYMANEKRGEPPVDQYLQAQTKRLRLPGLSAGTFRDGRILLANGYGVVGAGSSVAATKDTVYPLLSATKMFTGVAVMLLVEEGKFSLDDRIQGLLPDLPSAWRDVTVRHLLTHTSGIGNVLDLPDWEKIRSADEVIRRTAALPLEFQPGEKWSYNQTGYLLLKMLIEKVSGKGYAAFLDECIFRPLQMTSSGCGSPNDPGAWRQAATGVFSSISDLAKWDAALYTERLLKKTSLAQLWAPTKLKNGSLTSYGLGWVLGEYQGHRYVGHGGGTQNWIVRFVDDRLTVVVLANTLGADTHPLVDQLAAFYLPSPKPQSDEDAATTEKLRRTLLGLMAGQADPAQFSPEARATLLPEVKETSAFYRSLGPLKSFRLFEQAKAGGMRTVRYRARFRDTTWIQSFVLTEAGQIAELGVAPE